MCASAVLVRDTLVVRLCVCVLIVCASVDCGSACFTLACRCVRRVPPGGTQDAYGQGRAVHDVPWLSLCLGFRLDDVCICVLSYQTLAL